MTPNARERNRTQRPPDRGLKWTSAQGAFFVLAHVLAIEDSEHMIAVWMVTESGER